MDRRDALALLGTGTVSMISPLTLAERLEIGRALHTNLRHQRRIFTARERALVTRIADLILPRTETPGAVDVRVPEFVESMAADWFTDEERDRFRRGLAELDRRAGEAGFMSRPEPVQVELLRTLDGKPGEGGSAEAAFGTLKSQVIYGYFTSERVQKEVLKTTVIPGRFDGCV